MSVKVSLENYVKRQKVERPKPKVTTTKVDQLAKPCMALIVSFLDLKEILSSQGVARPFKQGVEYWLQTTKWLVIGPNFVKSHLGVLSTHKLPKAPKVTDLRLQLSSRTKIDIDNPENPRTDPRTQYSNVTIYERFLLNMCALYPRVSRLTLEDDVLDVLENYLFVAWGENLESLTLIDAGNPGKKTLQRSCPRLRELKLTGNIVKGDEALNRALEIPQLVALEALDISAAAMDRIAEQGKSLSQVTLSFGWISKKEVINIIFKCKKILNECKNLQRLHLKFDLSLIHALWSVGDERDSIVEILSDPRLSISDKGNYESVKQELIRHIGPRKLRN